MHTKSILLQLFAANNLGQEEKVNRNVNRKLQTIAKLAWLSNYWIKEISIEKWNVSHTFIVIFFWSYWLAINRVLLNTWTWIRTWIDLELDLNTSFSLTPPIIQYLTRRCPKWGLKRHDHIACISIFFKIQNNSMRF